MEGKWLRGRPEATMGTPSYALDFPGMEVLRVYREVCGKLAKTIHSHFYRLLHPQGEEGIARELRAEEPFLLLLYQRWPREPGILYLLRVEEQLERPPREIPLGDLCVDEVEEILLYLGEELPEGSL